MRLDRYGRFAALRNPGVRYETPFNAGDSHNAVQGSVSLTARDVCANLKPYVQGRSETRSRARHI